MKFLCVRCDEPMKLQDAGPPDRGSMSVVYRCPKCSNRIAMLTNPSETEVVRSLGVRIGPAGTGTSESKCPFSDVVEGMSAPAGDGIPWTPAARRRLDNVPEFVRPMARAGIEKFARDRGRGQVDEEVLDQAKDFFGM